MARYRSKISGPLRDRIDLHVEVPPLPYRELERVGKGEASLEVRSRVTEARRRQRTRQSPSGNGAGGSPPGSGGAGENGALTPKGIQRWCAPDAEGRRLLEDASDHLGLSARGIHRVLKVARTVADLEGAGRIGRSHLAEALQYRVLDREWGRVEG